MEKDTPLSAIVATSQMLQHLFDQMLAQTPPLSLSSVELRAQEHAIRFHLLNMAEEFENTRWRVMREEHCGQKEDEGLWPYTLSQAVALGWGEEDLARVLPMTHVEPVLTGHPTEAKRATVLEYYRELYSLLTTYHTPGAPPSLRQATRGQMLSVMERLWRTGEIFLERPDVASEVRNLLHHLTTVFPKAVTRLDQRLLFAWAQAGFSPQTLQNPLKRPLISFGTWVGGDRDGHPFVTPAVTAQTLVELGQGALGLLATRLEQLGARMGLSQRAQPTPQRLQAALQDRAQALGEVAQGALGRNPSEPWRQWVNLMLLSLPNPHRGFWEKGGNTSGVYTTSQSLLDDLFLLRECLVEVGAQELAFQEVDPVVRHVAVFGFHLASLDIRQNSAFHEEALHALVQGAGLGPFKTWPTADKKAFILTELATGRPFCSFGHGHLGPQANDVLDTYRVVHHQLHHREPQAIGALIVSMTRNPLDLFSVYLLAREVGLYTQTPQGFACPVPVVPLFETLEDLEASGTILEEFLTHRITQNSLSIIQKNRRWPVPVQQVMVGYSDSNKDGGIVASHWALHKAQRDLQALGRRLGVAIQFFHGRGGTISRGAGPTHRFLKALPAHGLRGSIRVTEQGETISQKYANLDTATFHLELWQAGAVEVVLHNRCLPNPLPPHPLSATMDRVASSSYTAYRALMEHPGFISFFRQATPIDIIERSRIGSRPTRRTGAESLSDLRAIPWVFSWNQSRFYLPGWFGCGSAFLELKHREPAHYEALREGALKWPPLKYLLTNVANSLMTAQPSIMEMYAHMVEDGALRNTFMGLIREEFSKTQEILEEVFGGPLSTTRNRISGVIGLRQGILLPLHEQQVSLIPQYRKVLETQGDKAAEPLLIELLMTVNAIAAGLRTTG